MPLGRLPQPDHHSLPHGALPRGPVILMMALGAWIALAAGAAFIHASWSWLSLWL